MWTNKNNMEQISAMWKNLRLLREQKGWSIDELSQISGINKKNLAKIESGKVFDIQYLFILCRLYNIKPHEIFSM